MLGVIFQLLSAADTCWAFLSGIKHCWVFLRAAEDYLALLRPAKKFLGVQAKADASNSLIIQAREEEDH